MISETMLPTSFSSQLLSTLRDVNSFYLTTFGRQGEIKKLYYQNHHVGFISPSVESRLRDYSDVFVISTDKVVLLGEEEEDTTERLNTLLLELRQKSDLTTLKGWRNEKYDVKVRFSDEQPLFKIERSATCLFGFRQYGVSINGYVRHPDLGLCLWFQRRSSQKPTWPGMWDNLVSGGLSEGFQVHEAVLKEAYEEANISGQLVHDIIPKGCVSFFRRSDRGISPHTEFVFDLELPHDFIPTSNDGEVEDFIQIPVNKVLSHILSSSMKSTSCPITIDFLIRHSIINALNEPNLPELMELLHIPIHQCYESELGK